MGRPRIRPSFVDRDAETREQSNKEILRVFRFPVICIDRGQERLRWTRFGFDHSNEIRCFVDKRRLPGPGKSMILRVERLSANRLSFLCHRGR